ncbi:MAG TPA: ribosome recycling factor [Flavobacteriaceae bacterium]|nr:ribosome recycling factor [Flavobacteriaceae bacterium]HEX5742756.1 ribosome recycling factor [Flavobacteriaceae bacterium]
MEELDFIVDSTEEFMSKAIAHLEIEFKNIRAGKASPAMLMGVKVDYYGTMTPLNQVANINTPDARTLIVQPWERKLISEIEKAILIANLGFNPMNNGENIIINVPVLTEERRKDLAKQAKAAAEETKVGIRNDRRNAMNEIKKLDASEDMKKNTEVDIQELTDKYIKIVDEHYYIKEKEIMTV